MKYLQIKKELNVALVTNMKSTLKIQALEEENNMLKKKKSRYNFPETVLNEDVREKLFLMYLAQII